MKTRGVKPQSSERLKANEEGDELSGYPEYPESEDIYRKFLKGEEINPEDISKIKEFIKKNKGTLNNEKDFEDDYSGSDLDVPGSELDDEQEEIGNEDEENNYYSLGDDEPDYLNEEEDEDEGY